MAERRPQATKVTRVTRKMMVPGKRIWAALGGAPIALVALALAACSSATGPAPSPNSLLLTQVPWCDEASITFQDDGKLSHPIVSDWNAVKTQLGFTPYLPTSLPKGSCLALVGGSIHDPIFGGHFRITYNLPGNVPLSFSEAPKQTAAGNLGNGVQCSQVAPINVPTVAPSGTASTTPSPTASPPLSVCVGNIANTNVSVASPQPGADLKTLFSGLQPNVDWVPQNSGANATATPKA